MPESLITPASPISVDANSYFLNLAQTASIKSKDPRCHVGAVIVSRDERVLSTGFNGFPRGVDDADELPEDIPEKLNLICHAEENAITDAARTGVALQNATIYVTKFPCLACCKLIIQAGISRIYTHDHRYWSDDPLDKGHFRKPIVLQQAGIHVEAPFHPDFSIVARRRQLEHGSGAVVDRKGPATSTEIRPGTGKSVSVERSGVA